MTKKYKFKGSLYDLVRADIERKHAEIAGFYNAGYRKIAEKKAKELLQEINDLKKGV